jgi:hypothetical protein
MSAAATPTNLIELKAANERRRQRPRPKPEVEPQDAGPHMFPLATAVRALPPMISDEILDYHAFVFCQGGFRQTGMTFEQFLLVRTTIGPLDQRTT